MHRLTNKLTWEEAKDDLAAEYGYSHIWQRLNAIENILSDDYDLDRLRPHGKWEDACYYHDRPLCCECSNCGFKLMYKPNYCPHCGAKMEDTNEN